MPGSQTVTPLLLVYTTQANSAFRMIWLVPQSRDIKCNSPPGGISVTALPALRDKVQRKQLLLYSAAEFLLVGQSRLPNIWTLLSKSPRKGPFTHAIFDGISRTTRALPYPARIFFSWSFAWIGKKVITYYFKTPFFPISANLAVFCRRVTRLKTRAG